MHKDQKTGPRGSTDRIASGLSVMEYNRTHGYCHQLVKVCSPPVMSLGTSARLWGEFSGGASMAEVVLIREKKSFEELAKWRALSPIQHVSKCIKLSPWDSWTKPGRWPFTTFSWAGVIPSSQISSSHNDLGITASDLDYPNSLYQSLDGGCVKFLCFSGYDK